MGVEISWEEALELLRGCGIDPEAGLAFSDNEEELYREVLRSYAENIESKAESIEECLAAGDLENYVILVHSLKSTAKTVGAPTLSGLALELETAGRAGDWETVREETGRLLALYRGLKPVLGRL